jgi:Flp pilus assembly protein TadD
VDAGVKAPPKVTYPPPKPLTIRLSHGDGSPADAELKQGDAAIETQDFAGAELHYKRAEGIAPKDLSPKVGRLRTRVAKAAPDFGFASAKGNADVKAAAAELGKLANGSSSKPYGPLLAELGRAELLLGDASAALTHLSRAAELMPDEPEVLSACGVAELASGNAEKALVYLRRGVELDMGSAPRHGNLGTVYFMLGRVQEAIAEYGIEVSLEDLEPRAHSDLGTALLAANDVQKGVAELRRAVALDPKRATFRSNLGYALQLSQQKDAAIAEYRKAIELDPKLVSAWVNLATILSREPATRAEARAALMTAKKLDPQDPRVKANLDELDALEKGQILR